MNQCDMIEWFLIFFAGCRWI